MAVDTKACSEKTTDSCPEPLPSSEEMAGFDAYTINSGIESLELMERAGRAVVGQVLAKYPDLINSGLTTVVCGPGNNGGDGLVIARQLHGQGAKVNLVAVALDRYSRDNLIEAARASEAGLQINYYGNGRGYPEISAKRLGESELRELFVNSSLIIEALLGTGQSSAPRGVVSDILKILLTAKESIRAPIVAVDLPCGVNGSTGEVYSPSLRCDLTVTVEYLKRGMLQYPAREFCGDIKCVSIGINKDKDPEFLLLSDKIISKKIPAANSWHKGNFGRVLVVAGSSSMPGASVLSSLAALKTGAGLVKAVRLKSNPPFNMPEVTYLLLEDCAGGVLSEKHFNNITDSVNESDAVLLGPGVGLADTTKRLVLKLADYLKQGSTPFVLDADALTIISQSGLKIESDRAVLTPHPGEASRLLNCEIVEVQRDRYSAVRKLSKNYGATVILKGAATVIYSGNRGVVSPFANPAMATAGSGDVLSGAVAALLARGQSACDAAALGVYIHALAAKEASRGGAIPLIASDIINSLPGAIGR